MLVKYVLFFILTLVLTSVEIARPDRTTWRTFMFVTGQVNAGTVMICSTVYIYPHYVFVKIYCTGF